MRLLRRRRAAPPPDAKVHSGNGSIGHPLLVLKTIANRQLVVACCAMAERAGIRPGMTLAQARALDAGVRYVSWRPDLDRRGIEALARYLVRFTPIVATDTRDITDDDQKTDDAIDHYLFMDLSGCEHLFGGTEQMVRQIGQTLHQLRIPSVLGLGPTPGAAYAITCVPAAENAPATRVRILMPKSADAISAAPLVGLRLPEEMLQTLHHLGLKTIVDLQKLPRDMLPSRFGKSILQRLDQLTGKLSETVVALTWSTTLEERFDFDGSVCDPQVLELVFRDLTAKLLLQLERKGLGIREIEITLERVGAEARSLTLNVSRPSRDARALMGLFRCAFDELFADEQKKLTRKRREMYSRNYDAGFSAMQLTIKKAQPLPHKQLRVDESQRVVNRQAWQNTLDLIRTRLGEDAVQQAQLEQSYLPEKAYRLLPAGIEEESSASPEIPGNRPLYLQSPPEELSVMVAPSHDADGIPLSFSYSGELHRVKQASGPERIAGQWWEGHHRTRDYFDVLDEQGERYWLFRVQETGKWYVHGRFE